MNITNNKEYNLNMQEAVKISKKELTEYVDSGAKIGQIMTKYGLNKPQSRKLLKEAGLKLRKFHYAKYELTEDNTNVSTTTSANSVNA